MFKLEIPSSDGTKVYQVRKVADSVWTCDCPDHLYRSNGETYVCKHIGQVLKSLTFFAEGAKGKSKAAEELVGA